MAKLNPEGTVRVVKGDPACKITSLGFEPDTSRLSDDHLGGACIYPRHRGDVAERSSARSGILADPRRRYEDTSEDVSSMSDDDDYDNDDDDDDDDDPADSD